MGAELFHADGWKDARARTHTHTHTHGRTDGQTDKHFEANSLFSQFCERA